MGIYVLLGFYAIMGIVAFFSYGSDKKKAKKSQWRTPEKVLLGLGLFGGAWGALLGMKKFRHKTKHWYFWAVNWAGIAWQSVLLVYLLLIYTK